MHPPSTWRSCSPGSRLLSVSNDPLSHSSRVALTVSALVFIACGQTRLLWPWSSGLSHQPVRHRRSQRRAEARERVRYNKVIDIYKRRTEELQTPAPQIRRRFRQANRLPLITHDGPRWPQIARGRHRSPGGKMGGRWEPPCVASARKFQLRQEHDVGPSAHGRLGGLHWERQGSSAPPTSI